MLRSDVTKCAEVELAHGAFAEPVGWRQGSQCAERANASRGNENEAGEVRPITAWIARQQSIVCHRRMRGDDCIQCEQREQAKTLAHDIPRVGVVVVVRLN